MDNSVTANGKNGCQIHSLRDKFSCDRSEYGLTISNIQRNASTPPRPVKSSRQFEFFSISHLLSGEGFYWTPRKKVQTVHPGQGIIITPGQVHNYGVTEGLYTEDSLCFYGPIADELFKEGIQKSGIVNIGQNRLLLPILELVINPSPIAQIKAKVKLQDLLIKLQTQNPKSDSNIESRILNLTEMLIQHVEKWWTVTEMADYCQLSESRFRIHFKKTTGLPPKIYLDKLKINQAAEYLLSNDCLIEEVAQKFSYVDKFHFSRRFKQIMGMSPNAYRTGSPQSC